MCPLNARNRAAAGAEFLDTKIPGWDMKIDPGRLKIGHGEACALGQLFGNFENGQKALGLSDAIAQQYGFFARNRRRDSYRALDAAWQRLLAERRAIRTRQVHHAAMMPVIRTACALAASIAVSAMICGM